jgi:hypothetical protein
MVIVSSMARQIEDDAVAYMRFKTYDDGPIDLYLQHTGKGKVLFDLRQSDTIISFEVDVITTREIKSLLTKFIEEVNKNESP